MSDTNIFGPVTDAGHNIDSDATGVLTNATSLNATDPELGALGNNGGPTPTVPLLASSPAIDAGDSSAFPPTDQRGVARPFGPAPDIGAYEYVFSNTIPLIDRPPANLTIAVGQTAIFSVLATGTPPLSYQWISNSTPLTDDGSVAGVHTNRLMIFDTTVAHSGSYSVVVSNSYGVVTSDVAILQVGIPPSISVQPQSQTIGGSLPATIAVTADGGPPLSYQWYKNSVTVADGGDVSGAKTATLAFSSVTLADAGSYTVTVNSPFGVVTSMMAVLTVGPGTTNTVTSATEAALASAVAGGGTITFAVDGVIGLTNTLVISNETVLDGAGHTITISGNNTVRIFTVNSGVHFVLKNLTVANGAANGASGAGSDSAGNAVAGGLLNNGGTVDIAHCSFVGNSAIGGNGESTPDGGSASGGAIYNNLGVMNISDSFFTSNSASGGSLTTSPGAAASGGALANNGGTIYLTNCAFVGNNSAGGAAAGAGAAGSSLGGAVFTAAGNVTISNGSFSGNAAASPGGVGSGGGIYQDSGTLSLVRILFATNSASAGMRPRYATPQNASGGGLFNGGTVNATNCTFLSNTVTGSVVGSASGTGEGGGIYNQGTANFVSDTWHGNLAIGGVGYSDGPYIFPSGPGQGGAVFNTGVMLLLNSTLDGNTAAGGSFYTSPPAGAYGGAIYNLGRCDATNDTIYGNAANGGEGIPGSPVSEPGANAFGGGIFTGGGTMTLAYLTISSNSADGGAGTTNGMGYGGGIYISEGSLLLLDSIVAENTAGMDFNFTTGTITDGGDNISSDDSFPFTAAGSRNNTDPMLGPLGNYGGPTQTMPLLVGSPAIDAASSTVFPPTDQRGVPRPYGLAPDIGAFEYVPPNGAPQITVQPAGQSVVVGALVMFSVTTISASSANYQWYVDATPLTNSTNISGVNNSNLVITAVGLANGGTYSVIVMNGVGTVTSSVVVLDVGIPPVISVQPASQTNAVGTTATFSVIAAGVPPPAYQWFKNTMLLTNGGNITGVNFSNLVVTSAGLTNGGSYSVVVTNGFGAVTSAVAVLDV